MMKCCLAIVSITCCESARVSVEDAKVDVDWGVPKIPQVVSALPIAAVPLQGPLKAIPIQQITQASGAALNAVSQAQKLAEIAAKLKALIEACQHAQTATDTGKTAVETLGTNTAGIHKNITGQKYEPLFDGVWKQNDMVALKSVDVYLGIVNTILQSTGQLTGVTGALNSIIEVLTSVVDLLTSVSELTPAIGDTQLTTLQGLSNDATTVGSQCDAEATTIGAAETKLRPVLIKWEAAGSPVQKTTVVAQNFKTFQTGFNDVGKAWTSVKAFYDTQVKPLMDKIVLEVAKLSSNVNSYQLPR